MQEISELAESEECNQEDEIVPSETQLSKRQLRKLIKREKWEKALPEKRAKEKLKMKQKRHSARLNNEVLGPSRKKLKANKMASSECTLRVALDMSFDDLMIEKDIAKCTKQLLRSYSFNRRAVNPVQFYVTSFEGKIRDEIKKQTGYEHWDVNLREEHYSHVFEAKDLVYLSSESDNVINELDHSKVYVIGGLVDHNSHKGLCHRLAVERGIAHGRLPIGEFLEMSSRKVLAINHVFEIVVAVSQGSSWQAAMVATLPQRKGAVAKSVDKVESSMDDVEVEEPEGDLGRLETESRRENGEDVVGETEDDVMIGSDITDFEKRGCSDRGIVMYVDKKVDTDKIESSDVAEKKMLGGRVECETTESDEGNGKEVLVMNNSGICVDGLNSDKAEGVLTDVGCEIICEHDEVQGVWTDDGESANELKRQCDS